MTPNKDESNDDTIHKRNLIRHDILPLFEKINPNTVNALNTLSKVTECELNILEEYLSSVKENVIKDGKILTKNFNKLSENLKQKIIYDYIYNSEIDYDFKLIENAVKFLNNSINNQKISRFSLTKNKFLYIDSKTIEIITPEEKNKKELEITKEGTYEFNNNLLELKKCCENSSISKDECCVNVDLSNYSKLTIRTRRDGDVIQPLGFNGTMKLKKYLMSKKIPQHKRDKLVLLCDEKEILWVAGVGLSEKIKTKEMSTHKLKIVTSD